MTSESSSTDTPNFKPHMPDVDVWNDMEETFLSARQAAANPDAPAIAIVTPGHRIVLPIPIHLLTSAEKQSSQFASLGHFVSLSQPQNITAICMTELSAGFQDRHSPDHSPFTGSRAIPFFGYLMAIGSLGHNVLIFEGHSSTLEMGCRNADVLIVDGGMVPFLQPDWSSVARSVMRAERRIFIFNRDGRIQHL